MYRFGPDGITKAKRRARPRANSAAATWGWNAFRSIVSLTRRTVSGRTPARLWRTRSTVARLTPALRAMSLRVKVVFASRFSIRLISRGDMRCATHFEGPAVDHYSAKAGL